EKKAPMSIMKKPLLSAALLFALAGTARAGTLPEPATAMPQSELEAAQRALERSATRQRSLADEAAALSREQAELSRQLVDAAARIKARESMIVASRNRLAELVKEESAQRLSLSRRNDQLTGLLAGLMRLEQNPPPALVAAPGDALAAVRAAMLFGAAVPALRVEAGLLSQDVARLAGLRASMATEQEQLSANLDKLRSARLQLEQLHDRKRLLLRATGSALAREKEIAAKLAEKARTLKQLVDALAEQARQKAAYLAQSAASAATEKPPLAFTQALGRLDYPVQGKLLRRFGEADGFGGETKGMALTATPGAQVIAPAAGKVAFAGDFRSYGQLLILDVGEGYHVLLAGMARIRVETGQAIVAGEPIGEMGGSSGQWTMTGDRPPHPNPVIYVEFRKAGTAIDPTKWWIGGTKEANSQKGMN
ncbi:MAG: murein hydrolase activator EnvC family protein, partial [Aestuariivirgaceae bacterium]